MATAKQWNWQQDDWPVFTYDQAALKRLEGQFLHDSGQLLGASLHIQDDERQQLIVDMMSDEALKTSAIEGETLNRESVQSSIRKHMGFATARHAVGAAEAGIAEMMVHLYQSYAQPLSHEMLYNWHAMIMNGRRDLDHVGGYRTHSEPMQVISGRLDIPTIHFEAPPSKRVPKEMNQFIEWFNDTAPDGTHPLPALTRASIAHLYFESIHPFEDGNGRIGRSLSEKALAQSLGRPMMLALSHTIHANRKEYYAMLEASNKHNQIDAWLHYFAGTILEAQTFSAQLVTFIIKKAKFYDRYRGQLNERQQKVIARIFRKGSHGFEGGLSAENYLRITGTSRPTATRDLNDLVLKSVLIKTGAGKGTRYFLQLT
jgi:Fic family protein